LTALLLVLLLGADPETAPEPAKGLTPPTASCPNTAPYPPGEKLSGISGKVVVNVTLDASGAVKAMEVAQPLGPAFDAAALETAKTCTFTGARMDGKPVPAIVQLSADFVPPLLPWTLEGDVVGELGEALPNAEVKFGGRTVQTDERGHFAMTFEGLPPGDGWVLVHLEGHADKAFPEVFRSGLTTRVRYLLPKKTSYETRVEGSRILPPVPEPDRTPQVSKFTITRADMDRSPGAYEDVARLAQAAPGVAADPDILGTLFVRGGGPDEMVFYLDGVPLSNPYHLGGFASIFNPMMLESAEFYTGGVPARYEPTLSGAMEVHYATGETKKLRVIADVSMQTAMLRADIPLGIEGLSAVVSARRSYFEAYFAALRALHVVGSNFAAPEITELLARVNYRHGRHQTTATYLFASDGINLNISPGEQVLFNFNGSLNISNQLHLASLQHVIDFGGDSRLTFLGAFTHDANNASSVSTGSRYANNALHDDFLLRADGVLAPNAKLRTQAGVEFAHRTLQVIGNVLDSRDQAPWAQYASAEAFTPSLDIQPKVTRDLLALYGEQTYRPLESLVLEAGGRGQVDADSGQLSGSGRVAMSWTLPTATVLKASAGVSLQPELTPLLLDPKFGNPNLQPERSWQVVAGVEQPLPIEALVRLEVWGKYLDNLVVNPDTPQGVAALQGRGLPVFQNGGTGFARGGDLLVMGRTRHFFYTLSLGLLWSDRTNPLAATLQTYPTPWDQRFTSGLSVSWSPTDKWLVTGRFSFRTGRPYTDVAYFTVGTNPMDGTPAYYPHYGPPDIYRYPPFYELSFRGERRFIAGPIHLSVYAEILNVTNSMNVFTYLYSSGTPPNGPLPVRGEVDHLPIRPFLGLRGEY
jgi:TonB family protein